MTLVSERLLITIDGPAASGKSSVARGVADALGIPFVSSGLLYRAATYLALAHGVDPDDEGGLLELLRRHLVVLDALPLRSNRILVDGVDVSPALHTDAVDASVSAVAVHPGVRDWVRERLRAVKGSFVAEGRDMGKAVFPQAEYKFFLTAPSSVRARRRVGERSRSLAEIAAALERRDQLDARQLEPAPDAIFVETGELDLPGVVARVLERLKLPSRG